MRVFLGFSAAWMLLVAIVGAARADESKARRDKPELVQPPVTILSAYLGVDEKGFSGMYVKFRANQEIYGWHFYFVCLDKSGNRVAKDRFGHESFNIGFGRAKPYLKGAEGTQFFRLDQQDSVVLVKCRLDYTQLPGSDGGKERRTFSTWPKDEKADFEATAKRPESEKPVTVPSSATSIPRSHNK
jgi:hypothetical protein